MNNQQTYATSSKNILKRPKPTKKVMKPTTTRLLSERSPIPRQSSPMASRSQTKQNKHEDTTASNTDTPNTTGTICPKQEPLDLPDDYNDTYDEHMDVSSMLDTTLGEPSSKALKFSPKSSTQDIQSPGKTLTFNFIYVT